MAEPSSSFSLESRLVHLGRATGANSGWTVPPTRMAAIRNDIAHGKGVASVGELSEGFDQALRLARAVVMKEVGII